MLPISCGSLIAKADGPLPAYNLKAKIPFVGSMSPSQALGIAYACIEASQAILHVNVPPSNEFVWDAHMNIQA